LAEGRSGKASKQPFSRSPKQRLPETIREHRAKLESATAVASGKMTVGDATQGYLEKVRASVSLKPRSKDFREMMIAFIGRS